MGQTCKGAWRWHVTVLRAGLNIFVGTSGACQVHEIFILPFIHHNLMASESNWHAIRPWAPSLSLAVREITSVSATFILSCGETDPSLATIGLAAAEGEAEGNEELAPAKNSVVADALARGLSVNVNGSAWPRAFIRIDDQLDEAVIIIYALMPGRQYDIELGLAPAGQPSTTIRKQVTTEGMLLTCGKSKSSTHICADDSEHDTSEIHTDPDSPNLTSSDTPSTSPSDTVPGTPPPQITLEDRLNQLQQTLAAVNSERENLLASLKTARKDAQKADSALRSEIDTLKRTSEKNTATELRGKQKIRALQEAVKRAQNAATETDEQADEVKRGEPDLHALQQAKELEHTKIKQEADRMRKEREDLEEKERKRLDAMRAELASLNSKLEKLSGKREKLETNLIPELEDKLKDVEAEIEAEIPFYRLHQQVMMARNSLPPPIQRPAHDWNSPTYQSQRRGSLKARTLSTPSPVSLPSSKSSPTRSSPTHTAAVATTSMLSSRAPAFEPSRPIGALKGLNGNSQSSIPIQRPSTLPVGAGRNGSGGSTKNGALGHSQWVPQGQGQYGNSSNAGYGGLDNSR